MLEHCYEVATADGLAGGRAGPGGSRITPDHAGPGDRRAAATAPGGSGRITNVNAGNEHDVAPSLGVVVPAYKPDLRRLARYVDELDRGLGPAELRIELDAPRPEVLERVNGWPATVNHVDRRRGKGAALAMGLDALDTDVLAFADADGSTPVGSLVEVVRAVPAADVAVGSRRHPAASVDSTQSWIRRVLGDGFAWAARRLITPSLHDYQCGAKAMTATVWSRTREHVTEPGFAWDVELVGMAHAMGFEVTEIPISWEDRPGSTVDPIPAMAELGRALIRVRHRQRSMAGSRFHRLLGGPPPAVAGSADAPVNDPDEDRAPGP